MEYDEIESYVENIAANFGDAEVWSCEPVIPPINVSNVFYYRSGYKLKNGTKLIYSRQGNPSQFPVERVLAKLDGGAAALVFSSGMAAIITILNTLGKDDELVISDHVYWPLRHWLLSTQEQHLFKVKWVSGTSMEGFAGAISPTTTMVWVETPTNPDLRIVDIPAVAALKPASATLVVDSTCATPVLLRPLQHGADLVVHSASKCLGGHNDLLGGCVVTRDDSHPVWEDVKTLRWNQGNAMGAFDCYLLQRSLATLAIRVERATDSALHIARGLAEHPAIKAVNYPGLESHPDKAIADRLLNNGCGFMMGVTPVGGAEACRAVCLETKMWHNATGFGSVMSLIEHRFEAEYKVRQSEQDYLRLSVGLERPDHLLDDIISCLD
jgi:cystathionine gamma-synthase